MDLIVKVEGRDIKANFDEYNAWLDEALKPYRGLVVQDDQVPDCKKIRAELNKAEKAINARKIEIKKEFMKPYTEFETETQKLMSKISEVSGEINAQIKDYEDRLKAYRREFMRNWWEANGIVVDYDAIHNEDLVKLSVSEKAVVNWLETKKANIESDMTVIADMPKEEKAYVMDEYLETADLPQAIRNYRDWKERSERIKEATSEKKEEKKPAEKERKVFARAEVTGYWKDLDKVQEYADSIGVDLRYFTKQYVDIDEGEFPY